MADIDTSPEAVEEKAYIIELMANGMEASDQFLAGDASFLRRVRDTLRALSAERETVLDREAESHRRHDAALDAKDRRIAELEAGLADSIKVAVCARDALRDGVIATLAIVERNPDDA